MKQINNYITDVLGMDKEEVKKVEHTFFTLFQNGGFEK